MTLAELKTRLAQNPELPVRLRFANGEFIPAHAHVTEVARIDKKFVDCGGTFRNLSLCRLQTWVSDDYDHRLKAGVLLKILDKAASFLPSEDIEVDVEHELEYITQFPVSSVAPVDSEIVIQLSSRHTDCLAKEKCCAPTPKYDFNPMKLQFKETASKKKRVLFVCIHNSARSQMAEAFLNQICGAEFEALSAGLEPGKLNPIVVEVMQEIGIDISGNKTKAVFNIFKSGLLINYAITVCDETSAERCPIFPGITKRLHWSFPDPSAIQGTHEEKLARTREIRDSIKAHIEEWCDEVCGAAIP